LFQSARQALSHINGAQHHSELIRRVYSSYKTGPFDSDTLTHIDINEIYKEIYNPERFTTPSVVVVDYAMPSMNGLELCASLSNPYIKRILLTGQADTDIAIQAFNEGLIDQFISKKDQDLEGKLKRSIANLQQHYFSKSFKLITDPVIANSQSRFINNAEFIDYFNKVRAKRKIIEYYLLDEPYAAFLMVDEQGAPSLLLVLPEDELLENIEQCKAANAPKELISKLRQRKLVPLFHCADNDSLIAQLSADNWQNYYTKATPVGTKSPFHCAILEKDETSRLLRNFTPDRIHSYRQHLSSSSITTKFLH